MLTAVAGWTLTATGTAMDAMPRAATAMATDMETGTGAGPIAAMGMATGMVTATGTDAGPIAASTEAGAATMTATGMISG